MEIVRAQPSVKGPEQWFTGDVWFDVVARAPAPGRARLSVLRPGDVVWTPPGEEHWHGAAPEDRLTR